MYLLAATEKRNRQGSPSSPLLRESKSDRLKFNHSLSRQWPSSPFPAAASTVNFFFFSSPFLARNLSGDPGKRKVVGKRMIKEAKMMREGGKEKKKKKEKSARRRKKKKKRRRCGCGGDDGAWLWCGEIPRQQNLEEKAIPAPREPPLWLSLRGTRGGWGPRPLALSPSLLFFFRGVRSLFSPSSLFPAHTAACLSLTHATTSLALPCEPSEDCLRLVFLPHTDYSVFLCPGLVAPVAPRFIRAPDRQSSSLPVTTSRRSFCH